MNKQVYLDYAATTPVDPAVVEKMVPYLTTEFGNPSSTHSYGQAAKCAVELARLQVADLLKADPSEILWTAGATESINLALKGAAQLYQGKGKHIITMKTEHVAVLDSCQELEKNGFQVSYLAPEKNGLLDLQKLKDAIRHDTILISIMHVNNEIGVIQDIKAIANLTANKGILFHVDAAQSAGKLQLNLAEIPIDLVSCSAHKIYGPKGVGVLFLRRKPRVKVAAQMHGGGQEQAMRSGTLATHQIVGMGEAFALAKTKMKEEMSRISQFRTEFYKGIAHTNISLNSDLEITIPTILNVSFKDYKSDDLIRRLSQLAISSGSACHAKKGEPSYVIRALGQTKEEAQSAIRFSFGRFTTKEEIELAVDCVKSLKEQA